MVGKGWPGGSGAAKLTLTCNQPRFHSASPQVGDLVCECEVNQLIGTDDPGPTTMLIESHERGYVARLLVEEGAAARVDACIAVLVDDPADAPALAAHTPRYPSANSGAGAGRMFCWQAYLKT